VPYRTSNPFRRKRKKKEKVSKLEEMREGQAGIPSKRNLEPREEIRNCSTEDILEISGQRRVSEETTA